MTNKKIITQHHATFENVRHVDEDGNAFWLARDLAPMLEYQDWRNFVQVVEKAKVACQQSAQAIDDHFGDLTKMVEIGSGAKRELSDIRLSRYACYLFVQNGDPSKTIIANGQTYFAMQTRRQELAHDAQFALFNENEKRLAIRNELAVHNKHLAAAAKDAGVATPIDYAIFQDHGYRGLYGGLGAKDIHARKDLAGVKAQLENMRSPGLLITPYVSAKMAERGSNTPTGMRTIFALLCQPSHTNDARRRIEYACSARLGERFFRPTCVRKRVRH